MVSTNYILRLKDEPKKLFMWYLVHLFILDICGRLLPLEKSTFISSRFEKYTYIMIRLAPNLKYKW